MAGGELSAVAGGREGKVGGWDRRQETGDRRQETGDRGQGKETVERDHDVREVSKVSEVSAFRSP
jgi:hypothetical protein